MGQKVHPIGFRVGVTRDWNSRWFAKKEEFASKLLQDVNLRKLIQKELTMAHISHIDIERASDRVRVIIHSGRPGMVIGRKGAQIDIIKEKAQKLIGVQNKLFIDIKEVAKPGLDAQIISDNIAFQLIKRVAFRRAMKKTIQTYREAGGLGIKIRCAGRLGGAEIARAESYKWGKIPLQTIRADIDYGFSEARTTYGIIGIKVWTYHGEKFGKNYLRIKKEEQEEAVKAAKAKAKKPEKK